MKIEVTKGTVYNGNKQYGVGTVFDLDDKEAKRLIAAGYAKAAGTGSAPPAPPVPEKPKEDKK
jgi:hypothetical protein